MKPIIAYSWMNSSGSNLSNISESIFVSPKGKTPEQLANDTLHQIQTKNPPKIGLRFWKELSIDWYTYSFDKSDPAKLIETQGYIEGVWQYWRDYFFYLAKLGVTPDYLIHDMEDGFRYWSLFTKEERRDFFNKVFQSKSALARLPKSVQSIEFDDFFNFSKPQSRETISDYDCWAVDKRADLLRRCFTRPIYSTFGKSIPQSNYEDFNIKDKIMYNQSNWRLAHAGITHRSSPVVYFDNPGNNPNYFIGKSKNQRWNHFIYQLNICRVCINNAPVVPWIAPPGYARIRKNSWTPLDKLPQEKELWIKCTDHLFEMGINTVIIWNPDASQWNPHAVDTDKFMDDYFSKKQARGRFMKNLPLVDYDSDFIETGKVKITYDEFMNLNS